MEELLSAEQAARQLGVKLSTVRAWTFRRQIPFVKLLGRRAVRYRQSDVERLIKAGLRPALRPIPEAPHDREEEGER